VHYVPQNDPQYIKLNQNIRKYSNYLVDTSNISSNNPTIYSYSWFSNLQYNFNFPYHKLPIDFSKIEKKPIECRTQQIVMFPNQYQKNILDFWFNAFNIMYNETIILLRKHLPYGFIWNYKIYYDKHIIFYKNEKLIKNVTSENTKFTNKKNAFGEKLDELLKLQNKTKQIFDKINFIKNNIKGINDKIKNNNKHLDNLMKNRKNLVEFEKLYLSSKKHKDYFLEYKNIRTDYLKSRKDEIMKNNSCFENNPKYQIPSHSIDGGIKKACANYKTCIDNLENDRIERFRVKCRNLDKSTKIVEIESSSFNKNKDNIYVISRKILGEMKYEYNGKDYKITQPRTSNIMFDGQKYLLLMPISIENKPENIKKPFIALDGGVRDFLTGFDNNSIIKFGHNVGEKIMPYYKKIDKLNNLTSSDNEIKIAKEKLEKARLDFINITKKYGKLKENTNKNLFEKLLDTNSYCEYLENIIKSPKISVEEEIKRCENTINNHNKFLEKIMENHLADKDNKHYKKRIINLIRMIKFNEERKFKLEKILQKPKEKGKYEKYLKYKRREKFKYYHKKVKWKVDEMQWKLVRDLGLNYETIIIGKLDSQSILQGELRRPTKRLLQTLSHYSFREKLVYKCLTLGSKVIVQNESYTTKMCSNCGYYNSHIKGEKIIKCKGCNKVYDRDTDGAKCIYLKSLE
jgi:IS605 OrfB family transposase